MTSTSCGEARDDAEVVRDQHDGHLPLLGEAVEQVDHARLGGHVESGRRLVGDQQLRIRRERHRDHHALAHPARELVRVLLEALPRSLDADLGQQLDGPVDGCVLPGVACGA